MPMLPLFNGAATSQSVVDNNQVQVGDILSTQTLNVVTVTDQTSATTSATGNNVSAAVVSGSLDVESSQQLTGNVNAVTHVNVADGGNSGETTVVTAATGNTSEADSLEAGPLTGNFTQTVDPGFTVKSENDYNAAAASATDASVSSQAIANSMGFAVSDTSANVTTTQTSGATVDAEGGSEVGGGSGSTQGFTAGTAAFSATAVANNVTATGTGDSSQTINATQTSNGPLTQAGNFVNVGDGQTVQGQATATSNNIAVNNSSGPLDVTASQTNTSFTFGDSVATAFQFGTGEATAFGVGNQDMAGNFGPSTSFTNVQVNTGGTEANASFTGDTGFDATSSATAMGNAAIAFACSQCGGVISVNNSQTSTNGVEAFSTTNITTQARSVNGVATAVGNNATFYVSQPHP